MRRPRLDTALGLTLVVLGCANVIVALFWLPYSPGFDDRTLYAAVYAYQHYGHLFYPFYDAPFMYIHPPTKYWLVGLLVSSGVGVRVATAGLLLLSYLAAVAATFAGRFTLFQRLALITALTSTVTVCPFISYRPENLTHGEIIGRLRPDDLVLVLWFGGLVWLEASRRARWSPWCSFAGGLSIGLASTLHYVAIPAATVALIYGGLIVVDGGPLRWRRLAPLAIGFAAVALPPLVALWPYRTQVAALILQQGGETASKAFSDVWKRHLADMWFLLAWTKRHFGNVWPTAALITVPVTIGIPPVILAATVLFAFRSSRVLALAAIWLPLAVLCMAHKWIGYELPEIALFLLACGWIVATVLDNSTNKTARLLGAMGFLLAVGTASPVIWNRGSLMFMDQTHSPELLRAMGRAVAGRGATMVVGPVYTSGEDNYVRSGTPFDPGIDFVPEREFHIDSAGLHDAYLAARTRVVGFVLTPSEPSASVVYFSAARDVGRTISGFVDRAGQLQRFSPSATGWTFKMLNCAAHPEDLSWATPTPPALIAGYIPRTDFCVNRILSSRGLDGRFASILLRRTYANGTMGARALVPLLHEAAADGMMSAPLRDECGCDTVEAFSGGLVPENATELVDGLRRSDRTIRFFATPADFETSQSMDRRFYGETHH